MFKRLLSAWRASGTVRLIRSAFDAAKNTLENRRHWKDADALDASSAMNPAVRERLRRRARYEMANNPIVSGIGDTLAGDVVGVGPGLQLEIDDHETGAAIEDRFHEWAEIVNLWEKSRVAEVALLDTGETFWKFFQNDALPSAVKLDVELIEADRVATPFKLANDPTVIDGIKFDELGNRFGYWINKRHPGSTRHIGAIQDEFEFFEARHVIHDFKLKRAGQIRGIPDLTPSLGACAMLRRWVLAVLRAAEVVATLGAVLIETDLPAGTTAEIEALKAGEGIELERGMATVLPHNTKAHQMKPEQPASTHEAFIRAGVREIARPISMPLNVALCDSSGYNYSSGRLDHQTYDRSVGIRQDRRATRVLSQTFLRFHGEAALIKGFYPQPARAPTLANPSHSWLWQERLHVDPEKVAKADEINLGNRTVSYRTVFGRGGKDYRREFRQIEREQRDLEKKSIVPVTKTPALVAPNGTDGGDNAE